MAALLRLRHSSIVPPGASILCGEVWPIYVSIGWTLHSVCPRPVVAIGSQVAVVHGQCGRLHASAASGRKAAAESIINSF